MALVWYGFKNSQFLQLKSHILFLDAAPDAVYNKPLAVIKIIKILLCFLALDFAHASLSARPCREILKHPSVRDKAALKKEIFEVGESLLKEFFGHGDFGKLNKQQRLDFLSHNKNKILENIIQQGTVLEPLPNSSAFVVSGGTSRLARVAIGLKKMDLKIVLDMETLLKMHASGYYSPQKRMIMLGLEDALFPNQMSYNLLHEAFHASLDYKSLFIPRIYDQVSSQSYKDFSVDEVFVYSKQIMQMVNANIKIQNRLSLAENPNSEIVEAVKVYKELSLRTLRKKNELLKIVEYLKKIEEDPRVLEEKNDDRKSSFVFDGLDSEIVLHKSAFYQSNSDKAKEKASLNSIRDRAWVSRLIIEDVLYFAEMAFR
jgi:hypothetical protein